MFNYKYFMLMSLVYFAFFIYMTKSVNLILLYKYHNAIKCFNFWFIYNISLIKVKQCQCPKDVTQYITVKSIFQN